MTISVMANHEGHEAQQLDTYTKPRSPYSSGGAVVAPAVLHQRHEAQQLDTYTEQRPLGSTSPVAPAAIPGQSHSSIAPGQIINNEELRIVMVGKTGIGKSATGNTILGRECFESKFSAKSMTVDCSKGRGTVDGQKVAVIDTPGLFDTRYEEDKTAKDLSQCISYAAPGPHAFLVVIRLGRFTQEEKKTVQRIQEIFGQAADKYSMVLFTHGDQLDTTIEDFLAESPDLQELVARCNGQYHVLNNRSKDHSKVTELLQKITDIVKKNGGSHYTNQMFQEAERIIEEKKEQILKEKHEQMIKEREELEKNLREKFEMEMNKIKEQLQAEREREKKEREEERKREREEREEEREERKREREEREEERKREREEREEEREERKREREEREEERKKEREEEREERKRIKEQFEIDLREQMKDLWKEQKALIRKEAEKSNPIYHLAKAGEHFFMAFKELGKAFRALFK